MIYKNTSTVIAKYRKAKGLKQIEVAKKLGHTTAQAVSNIERGVTAVPRSSIKMYCKILSIPRKELVNALVDDIHTLITKSIN